MIPCVHRLQHGAGVARVGAFNLDSNARLGFAAPVPEAVTVLLIRASVLALTLWRRRTGTAAR